ncbi:MAG: tyrosine protein phosphatase [Streptococcaceae bacterium]|nr:tyrosine protein phosphatase [Streptococcaceae bacterium]
MIDLHCHILHSVDDGAKSLKESIKMAKKAVKSGITHILCTPHHNHRFDNPKDKVIKLVKNLQQELDKCKVPLRLLEGQEVKIHRFLMNEIENNKILFADVTNKYLILEFPTTEAPAYIETLLIEMIEKKIIPVIVHPERYIWAYHNHDLFLRFLNMGCLAQLTAPSLVGNYGSKIKKQACKLIQNNLVHMVASDAHGVKTRNFYLKEAFNIIEKKYGQEKVDYFKNVARAVINGDVLSS